MCAKLFLINYSLVTVLIFSVVASANPEELPVYKLSTVNISDTIYDNVSLKVDDTDEGIWCEDEKQLWNIPEGLEHINKSRNLVTDEEAKNRSSSFIVNKIMMNKSVANDQAKLSWKLSTIPRDSVALSWEPMDISNTIMIIFENKNNTTPPIKLDEQVHYDLRIQGIIQGFDIDYPIFSNITPNVILGEEGKIIGYKGPEPIVEEELVGYFPVIPEQQAYDIEPVLAYYMHPDAKGLLYLYPVYIYRDPDRDKELIINPATKFNLTPGQQNYDIYKERTSDMRLIDNKSSSDYYLQPATEDQSNAVSPQAYDNKSLVGITTQAASLTNMEKMPKYFIDPDEEFVAGITLPGPRMEAEAYYRFKTYNSDWKRQKDAEGFLQEFDSAKWICNKTEAYKSAYSNKEIDMVDIVFHSSHGDSGEWECNDGYFSISDESVKYGSSDLEWIVLDCCSILKDSCIPKWNFEANVFNLAELFGGLHLLLGFGTDIDNKEMTGRKLVQHMKEGDTIIHSWFRTAKEVQNNPNYYAGVLLPYNKTLGHPANDHLWGNGTVSPDIKYPDGFIAIYSPC